jgi:uncharacterized membrane protein
MKSLSEKKLFEIISDVLRSGVVLFMVISLFSFLFKNSHFHQYLLNLALIILILTPVMRILILAVGFYKLGDKRYSFYSSVILILLFLGLFIKK